ncbi:GTP-binding protein [Evansella cellulosilytica]|uniref:Cobalamin synthesis CobW domain protein n=1 Tax=Evansella cellulosilytica (strain ATCC 21833 / DSM 2522 / FERM P-1141 / JCM 9156 / N-4) TaxID=649639 RepID=E6TZ50_EVAC2|nr:GTP-binding protein [Evansella cellulosilytica]ADU32493.1 cobalamin synthesis CobW domain protein [Evansella cellulosilytica DSM 2522]
MTAEKQVPITLVTGMSDSIKSSLIQNMKLQNKSKVILFRDRTVENREIFEEEFIQDNILTEVVHDIEIFTEKDLLSILMERTNKKMDSIIIDLERFSNIKLHFPHYFKLEDDDPVNVAHVHVVDAVTFWFQYSSTKYVASSDGRETYESSIGELLIAPLEMADTIVIGNNDKINQERLAELQWFLNKLNPLATIVTLNDFKRDSKLFEEKNMRKWRNPHELYTFQLQLFEQKKTLMLVSDYGIDTYIYRSPFPVSMEGLEEFFKQLPDGILRTKAVCYSPSEKQTYYFSQIGSSIEVFSEEETYVEQIPSKTLSEFLFIGDHLDPLTIQNELDNSLLKYETPSVRKMSK